MFDTVLVANRAEIARRIIRSARSLGARTVAVYSDADEDAPHVSDADTAVRLGPPPPVESYLHIGALLDAARRSGADAVHPGYGFLAESPAFATAVLEAGLAWIGPHPQTIEALGDKLNARRLLASAGFPVNPGTDEPVHDVEEAVRAADGIGYPLMVKAAAGGGGIGMRVARDEADLRKGFDATRGQAERFFGDGRILLERCLPAAHHVEVQILGLADGRVVALGERECSVQRRYQKVAEETPSPAVDDSLRTRMLSAARTASERLGYRNAGTIECLVADGEFVFLECNARLQVEHPVTELVTGIDLVAEQLRVAAGEPPGFDVEAVTPRGHALELRVYAEDPKRFLPSPGKITTWQEPTGEGIRVDAGYIAGGTVSQFYDPLLAKLCVWTPDRAQTLAKAADAVSAFRVEGPKTNLPFLAELLDDPEFRAGSYDTGLVERMRRPTRAQQRSR